MLEWTILYTVFCILLIAPRPTLYVKGVNASYEESAFPLV